jgi:hypothetical protein
MAEKNKFGFVNDITNEVVEDTFDLRVKELDETPEQKAEREINAILRAKKQKRTRNIKITIGMTVLSGILFLFAMLWQDDWSLLAVGDGLWLVFALELCFGWVLFVYNHNIFSPVLYGVKSFTLMFVGKRPKTDYYTYMKNVQDNPIESYFYWMFFIAAFIIFIPALITLLVLI